jgi:alpha-L-rhamnosidase
MVSHLRCEDLVDPLGIDSPHPRLSWMIESDQRGQEQIAYQILVASSQDRLRADVGDLWDTGRQVSDETIGIQYAGRPLASRQVCFWKVRVWDRDGKVGQSKPARWEMGLLQPADWQASWIAPTKDIHAAGSPLLRKDFTINGRIKRARAYACGLGYFELVLNGRKVGDHLLDPGYTRYDKRVLYVTHDVTDLLKAGRNTVGAMLGNGWYNVQNKAAWDFDKAPWRASPRLLCQIEVELTNGRTITVASDSSWKSSEGPIVFNTIYSGETYDGRLEKTGWDSPGFDDSGWRLVPAVEPPAGVLSSQMMPAIQVDRVLDPVSITQPKGGIFVFDFGQALSGHVQLRVHGPAGAAVTMEYAERLAADGLVDQKDIATHVVRFDPNQPFQTDTYILKGKGTETWHSRFTYHGFRYVEVTGFPGRPSADSLRAVFFHSAVPVTGRFACSNPLLNRIWEASRWSYLGNLQGIPTDCPHREKNGWTGDAHLAAEQAMFNFFPAAVYTKWIRDLADEQRPDGRLPGIVPTGGWGYSWGNGPAWDSALVLIPYYQYVYYGDAEALRRNYDPMKRYVDYLTSRAKDGIVNIGLNDWAPYDTKTEAAITDTAYYYVDTKVVALAADLLARQDEAQHYRELAVSIKAAFNTKFYHPDTATYDNAGQTALSCALYQGLVYGENKARVLDALVGAVDKRNGHIDTGILGAKYLLNTLLENGRVDVAYRIVTQKDLPGWGWWIEQGATTLWEEWRGDASRFHIMYGDVSAWFYKALAGIRPVAEAPGFKHVLIEPHPVADLTSAGAEYDSVRGRIISAWRIKDGRFILDVTIPANATATVSLPISDQAQVQEGRRPAVSSPGVQFIRSEAGRSLFNVGSGTYRFAGPLNKEAK